MVAEDRPGAERRRKPRKFGRPDSVGHTLAHDPIRRGVIAEQDDDIGFQRVGGIDHVANVRERHIRTTGMQVGDHGHGKLAARRPARRIKRVAGNNQTQRLDAAGVNAGRERGDADEPGGAAKNAAAGYACVGGRFASVSFGKFLPHLFRRGVVHAASLSAPGMNGVFIAARFLRCIFVLSRRIGLGPAITLA